MSDTVVHPDRWLWPLALACGLAFFFSLGRLWPLAAGDLTRSRGALVHMADSVLATRGLVESGRAAATYRHATQLDTDESALDYVERTYGRDAAQALGHSGAGLAAYDVLLKRPGDPDGFAVRLDPFGRVLGWSAGVQDDRAGARLTVDSARVLARDALATLGVRNAAAWVEKGAAARERPHRTDHTFTYERVLAVGGDLRERAVATVSGDVVTGARRTLVVPARGTRAARARQAPVQALQTAGFALLVAGVIGALAVFLQRLRDGTARLGRAAFWSAVVFACAFLTNALADYALLAAWDPLWPRPVAVVADLAWRAQGTAWTFVVLFALIAAGDALDRGPRTGDVDGPKGATLWALGRGHLTDPAVGLASLRGFAIGLVCGGVMAGTVALLDATVGAFAAVQPRGFFSMASTRQRRAWPRSPSLRTSRCSKSSATASSPASGC